jgi:lipoic acid synthetase
VFNHNLETVPSHYLKIRPARATSIRCAAAAGEGDRADHVHQVRHHGRPGEERDEVLQLMDDLRSPTSISSPSASTCSRPASHAEVKRFVTAEEFKAYETIALAKGFPGVSSSPLTRSSYHAGDDFQRLKAAPSPRTVES